MRGRRALDGRHRRGPDRICDGKRQLERLEVIKMNFLNFAIATQLM